MLGLTLKFSLGLTFRVCLSNRPECMCGQPGLSVQSLSQPFKELRIHLEGCQKPSAKFKNELGTTGPTRLHWKQERREKQYKVIV
uniref:Uncharacterized protein n=1 Tax=Rhipicephalus appendiculatus TaxID=34631 RepID=A0A131YA57_RHIAP